MHAGAAYVDPLRGPLAARGAVLAVPLAHLRQGEQLAWYGRHPAGSSPAPRSTFRRTLAAILRPVIGLDTEDDPKLSDWITTHLGVNAVPVPDPDRLAEAETTVLDLLDPPLNLRGRPPTAIRARLTELCRDHRTNPADRTAHVPPAQGATR